MNAPDLRARLEHSDAKVRRIALRDLLAAPPTLETLDRVGTRLTALTSLIDAPPDPTHLDTPPDPQTHLEEAALCARVIGHWAHAPARSALESAIANPHTHALVAHEARIALDRIDLVAMGKIPHPLG